MFGVSQDQKLMVMEYCNLGSLKDYLYENGRSMDQQKLIQMLMDIASGMNYVHSLGILHRDLACRNVLVSGLKDNVTLKISDFGMSKQVESYYTSEKAIPVRWAALEVLTHKKFSKSSDVWAFGVTAWEIFEWGTVPFGQMTNHEVYDAVIKGTRLEQPDRCPDQIWEIILSCWKEKTSERPSFDMISSQLSSYVSRRSEREYLTESSIQPYYTKEID
eukprot:TRINITY_DN9803_c0_g2_i2.p1 TRINITY_DN9803_c0_g2~~TRINITY_DN9803_c0_g2_i2.p1  ORF type:complete len:218 (+),score=38.62 TRINITY_DN9803_c0_g2_i2:395-1048(+)